MRGDVVDEPKVYTTIALSNGFVMSKKIFVDNDISGRRKKVFYILNIIETLCG